LVKEKVACRKHDLKEFREGIAEREALDIPPGLSYQPQIG